MTLFHYADLLADLPGQVRRLASATDLPLPADLALYRRRVADHVAPDLDAWLHH